MSVNTYDAIIIGAGHNGLIAGAYLARAGKKVVILERRPIVGGAAVTEEIFPGYRFTEFSYVVSLLRPEIIRDLELPKHGLKICTTQAYQQVVPSLRFSFTVRGSQLLVNRRLFLGCG